MQIRFNRLASAFLLAAIPILASHAGYGQGALHGEVQQTGKGRQAVLRPAAKPAYGFSDMVVSPDNRVAYIAEIWNNKIAATDLQTGAQIGWLPIDSPNYLALSSDGKSLYAVSTSTGKVISFDTATCTVKSDLALVSQPNFLVGLGLSQDGKRLYAGCYRYGKDAVAVIDTSRSATIEMLPVSGMNFLSMACDSNNPQERIYVLENTKGLRSVDIVYEFVHRNKGKTKSRVIRTNLTSLTTLAPTACGDLIIATNSCTHFAGQDNNIKAIDRRNGSVVFDLPIVPRKDQTDIPGQPAIVFETGQSCFWKGTGLALSRTAPICYALNGNKGISVYDLNSGRTAGEIPLGIVADCMAITRDGQTIYAAGAGKLLRVNIQSASLTGEIPLIRPQ